MEEQITQEIRQYLKLLQDVEECKTMFSMLASRGCEYCIPQIAQGVDEGHVLCRHPKQPTIIGIGHVCAVNLCPLGGSEQSKDYEDEDDEKAFLIHVRGVGVFYRKKF